MSKYIDADRLKAEIEKLIKEVKDAAERFTPDMGFFDAKLSGIHDVMAILYSLQQEQPEKPVPNDLEEAAEISFDEARALTEDYLNFLAKGLKENHPRPIGPHWFCEYAKNRFIAGAKWQKEQMMNGAVEGTVMDFSSNRPRPQVDVLLDPYKYHTGDKVHAIIVKEEGK